MILDVVCRQPKEKHIAEAVQTFRVQKPAPCVVLLGVRVEQKQHRSSVTIFEDRRKAKEAKKHGFQQAMFLLMK
jgi:hypothetical protein